MSVMSLAPLKHVSTLPTPLCDKRFQKLRILASIVSGLCAPIFLKVASLLILPCSKNNSYHLSSQASYYFLRSLCNFIAFSRRGMKIIDLSVNSVRKPKVLNKESEIEALKKLYGHETITNWSTIGTEKVPLNQELLMRLEMGFRGAGCCLGMSTDFISRYLKELKQGKTPMEAVKIVAPIYADGATAEAEVAQIFASALDTTNVTMDADDQADWNIRAREIEKWSREELSKLGESSGQYSEDEFSNKAIDIYNKTIKKLGEESRNFRATHPTATLNCHFQKEVIISKKMGLAERLNHVHLAEAKRHAVDQGCQQLVNDLPEGVYNVDLYFLEEGRGHAIVFIKTSSECFIFDSNVGTFALAKEDAAREIWDAGKRLYIKGHCGIGFSSVSAI